MIFTLDPVTAISLTIASGALVLAAFTLWISHRESSNSKIIEKGLEARSIVSEFVQRSKRLEQEIVDLKVKLEVMELRTRNSLPVMLPPKEIQRNVEARTPDYTPSYPKISEMIVPRVRARAPANSPTLPAAEDHEFSKSEREALRIVQGSGGTTAREIQNRIGRTREHTARLMNSLYKEGLVERDEKARPFTYSITQKGIERLGL